MPPRRLALLAGPPINRSSAGIASRSWPTVIARVNAALASFADGKQVRYLDVNSRLANAAGELVEGMMHDRLHPTRAGYQVWADGLKPLLTELLGPPAAVDHAPPPTGVPKGL